MLLRIANWLLRISHCELRTTLSALLCALRASAVKKVDDFDPLQQMRGIKFITKKPAGDFLSIFFC
jgi:hypothetical protein